MTKNDVNIFWLIYINDFQPKLWIHVSTIRKNCAEGTVMDSRARVLSVCTLVWFISFFCVSASIRAEEVVLTSEDVVSALDIEHAIDVATNFGVESGLVLLDGNKGDFFYTGLDRSINIGDRSEFELRGINGATLANCDDGLFFGHEATHDITIRGITFICDGSGMREGGFGLKENVVIVKNVFEVGGSGVLATNTVGWSIKKNDFLATGDLGVIGLFDTVDAKIVNNTIEGTAGVRLSAARNVHLINNVIITDRDGIRLSDEATLNKVIANTVSVVSSPAVLLGISTFDNKIHGNFVVIDDAGQAIDDLGINNKITGNRPR